VQVLKDLFYVLLHVLFYFVIPPLEQERIWMSKNDNSTASNRVERTEQEHRIMSTETSHETSHHEY